MELDQAVEARTAADLEEEAGDNSGDRESPVRGGEEASAEEVEAALDEILRERFESSLEAVEKKEAEEAEEEVEEGLPLDVQGDEFVCRRCFLIKKRAQLADPVTHTCSDCAAA